MTYPFDLQNAPPRIPPPGTTTPAADEPTTPAPEPAAPVNPTAANPYWGDTLELGPTPPPDDTAPTADGMSAIAGAPVHRPVDAAPGLTGFDADLATFDRHFDVFDNPGGGDGDGIVSREDLDRIATGDFNRERAEERLTDAGVADRDVDATLTELQGIATTILHNRPLFDELDTANDPGGDPDGKISRGDLHAYQQGRHHELVESGVDIGTSDEGIPTRDYVLPADPLANVRFDEASRTDALIAEQEQLVLTGLATGEPVDFTNSDGDTEQLTFSQVSDSNGDVRYQMTAADGHTVNIDSRMSAAETRVALARLGDYHTQTPEHLRHAVDDIVLLTEGKEGKPSVGADYNDGGDRVRFYNGLSNVMEGLFHHEMAHGIKDQYGGSEGTGPTGWDEAMTADGASVSTGANKNDSEDFSESWAAFLTARDEGPTATAELEAAYPARFAIMQAIYDGTYEA